MLIADKAFYAEAGRRAARRRNDCRDPAQGNPATALGAEVKEAAGSRVNAPLGL
ncbi:MAG: hypothetical protein WA864_31815 [Acetobacteraceae bacterium]